MKRDNDEWYDYLVHKSRTDHIYDLMHTYLSEDWHPGHDLDFVVTRIGEVPAKLAGNLRSHYSPTLNIEDYTFPGNDFILLNGDHLTEYLEAAKEMKIIEDFSDRSFIQLVFSKNVTAGSDQSWDQYMERHWQQNPEMDKREAALMMAYELLSKQQDKELALEFAIAGHQYLDERKLTVGKDVLNEMSHIMMGYNIVAMVYAWNGKIDAASAADDHYLLYPHLWDNLKDYIAPHLELLMIKKQVDYLQYRFENRDFREYFLPHYEAFVSLFINDRYPLTRMSEVIPIINRIKNS